LFVIGLGSFVLASPALVYIYREVSHPLFTDFISRAGSIQTHLPSPQSFYIARWIILNLAIWLGIRRLIPELKNNTDFTHAWRIITSVGLAILLLLMCSFVFCLESNWFAPTEIQ